MKKLRIVMALLAVGVVAASGVFAQDIKFDGYVNTGLGVVASNEEDVDPFIVASGLDSWRSSFRIRLNANYTNQAGNAGVFLRLQAQGGGNAVSFPAAYGWVSAFNKILTVKSGLVDDSTWTTDGYFLWNDQGEGLGALAKISPISGLDIGFGVYLAETPTAGNNEVNLDDPKYTVNLAYTATDLVKIIASYRSKSHLGTTYNSSQAIVGVSLLSLSNLKAVLELQLDNLQDFNVKNGDKDAWDRTVGSSAVTDNDGKVVTAAGPTAIAASGKINFIETFEYKLGEHLTVGLWAVQWLSQAEDTDISVYANPWVSYAFGSIVPRLDTGFGSGSWAGFNNSNLNWYRQNYEAKYDSDYSVISIRPSVKFNIDPKIFVEIGDLIDIEGGPENTWADKDSRISNVFYVDFKWSF